MTLTAFPNVKFWFPILCSKDQLNDFTFHTNFTVGRIIFVEIFAVFRNQSFDSRLTLSLISCAASTTFSAMLKFT